jgi:hypothetical protein
MALAWHKLGVSMAAAGAISLAAWRKSKRRNENGEISAAAKEMKKTGVSVEMKREGGGGIERT